MQPWVDGVLHALLRKSRSSKQTDLNFIKVHQCLLEMILDTSALKACSDCSDPSGVAEHLASLTTRWEIGRSLFLHMHCRVTEQRIELHIKTCIESCFYASEREVTLEIVQKAKAKCMDEVRNFEGFDDVPLRRECRVSYRDTTCLVPVCGVSEEIDIRFAAVAKGLAVDAERLQKTFMEEIIVQKAPRPRAKRFLWTSCWKPLLPGRFWRRCTTTHR